MVKWCTIESADKIGNINIWSKMRNLHCYICLWLYIMMRPAACYLSLALRPGAGWKRIAWLHKRFSALSALIDEIPAIVSFFFMLSYYDCMAFVSGDVSNGHGENGIDFLIKLLAN